MLTCSSAEAWRTRHATFVLTLAMTDDRERDRDRDYAARDRSRSPERERERERDADSRIRDEPMNGRGDRCARLTSSLSEDM
jgi:hypothetical protein